MKVEHLRILPAVLLYVVFVVLAASPAMADNKPYFKVFGSDVMTGGWFASGGTCDTSSSSNYQDPTFSNVSAGLSASDFNGGILAYAKNDGSGHSQGGSSSQFGVLSTGSLDGDSAAAGVKGFYSGGAAAVNGSTNYNYLTFANNTALWGGKFEGSVRQSNCLPDYYSKKPSSATVKTTTDYLGAYNATGSYTVNSVPAGSNYDIVNSGPVSIADGTKITVYVNGNVYIGNNITYSSGNDANNMPKFALVVKGSIYIAPTVTRLDGFYIAEPAVSGVGAITSDTGILWTCHPNDQAQLPYTYPAQNCASKLVINGAVVAKQVNFMRTKGDVSSAPAPNAAGTEDTIAGANSSSNISEVINYTPQMLVGGSFFTTSSTNSASGLPIDSIFSLPPVF